jgi:hypothetical protein
LARFRIGYFYSEVEKDYLRRKIAAGDMIEGLDGRPPLDMVTVGDTDRVVAMARVHPYIELLDRGADIIIGGRSSDCAIFAAPAIRRGLPAGLAYFAGKVLECASTTQSMAATPSSVRSSHSSAPPVTSSASSCRRSRRRVRWPRRCA